MKKTLGFSLSIFLFTFTTHYAYASPPKIQPRAGGPIPGLTANQLKYFNAGLAAFSEVASVTGTEPGTNDGGLGPRFNLNSCVGCHSFPATGGSSPPVNPQVAVATEFGAKNTVPSFITINGPVREARFIRNPDGSPDGGVHALYVIAGRADAPGCNNLNSLILIAQSLTKTLFLEFQPLRLARDSFPQLLTKPFLITQSPMVLLKRRWALEDMSININLP